MTSNNHTQFRCRDNRKKCLGLCFLFLLFQQTVLLSAQELTQVKVGDLSGARLEDQLPKGWEPLSFKKIKKQTHYRLEKTGGVVVIVAQSDASASGLIYKKKIDPTIFYPSLNPVSSAGARCRKIPGLKEKEILYKDHENISKENNKSY